MLKTSRESQEAAPRTSHQLLKCQIVSLGPGPFRPVCVFIPSPVREGSTFLVITRVHHTN